MPEGDLQGTVGLDINPAVAAMRRLAGAAGPAGRDVGKAFKSQFMRFFGAGALVATIQKSLAGAAEIKREASKLKIDTSTFQALQQISQQTGHSVEDLTEKVLLNADATAESKAALTSWIDEIKNAGTVIDAGTIDRLAAIFTSLQQIFARLAPVIAWTVDKVRHAFDAIAKGIEAATAGAIHLIGTLKVLAGTGIDKVFGKELGLGGGLIKTGREQQQVGREMAKDVFGDAKNIFEAFGKIIKDTAEPALKAQRKIELPPEEKRKSTARQSMYTAQVDALTKVGGYIYGSPAMQQATQQLTYLQKIEARLQQLRTMLSGQLSS